jgi:membrane associated rhomboid family serine protease
MAYGGYSFGYTLTPWVKRLLIANGVLFLLNAVTGGILNAYFAFRPSGILFAPWGPFTYMFMHGGFFHLFFNMLALFFFGPPLEDRWGSREFIKYYLICGLGGAALSFLFAFDSSVVGASAAVFGIMLAFALNWPDSPIYIWGIFPVKAKYLVGALAVLALFSAVQGSSDGVAHFAHIGGFVAGFIYLKLDGGTAPGTRLKRLFNRPRLTVASGRDASPPPPQPPRRARAAGPDEERLLDDVDRVLDKISTSGLSSLSPEERKLLDEVSQRYRKN